jgi:hypothetical protein
MKSLLLFVLAGISMMTFGCKDDGDNDDFVTQPIGEDHSSIVDPHARWQAYHLTNYEYEQQNSCFCAYGGEVCRVYVRNNQVVDVVKKSDGKSIFAEVPGRYKTVDELFALAASLNKDSVASLIIAYDGKFGFPALISVDPNAHIADEEYAYQSANLERLVE